MVNVQYFTNDTNEKIAYMKQTIMASAENPPMVVFLGGFMSDMLGSKAEMLSTFCAENSFGYLRMDYRGHGASDGKFTDLGIGDWLRDVENVLLDQCPGPIILIGSSMGGWLATLFARKYPNRVARLIGIAAAPDFTEDSFWAGFSSEERARIDAGDIVNMPSGYDEPYPIGARLIHSGRENLVLRSPLKLDMPVRLFLGGCDNAVSIDTTLKLFNHIKGDDVELTLVKDADHSFSRDRDLAKIFAAILG